ncbi:MAG: M23 family metallopeptidase [Flavobacteriaceae bacterium]|nr:M23 family metallopeptidase [Flavobacteriaceae bacterium]
MKSKIFILAIMVVLSSCWKDDEGWKQELNGTGDIGLIPNIQNCADAEYPDWQSSAYYLPYPIGESYVIGLGHCDGSYHSAGLPDMFAIDVNMPIGQRIVASRSGVVIAIEERGIDGGFPNNFVLLQHQDDTYAWYMHLTNNGAVVNVGETVPRGGLIGYSGNTGLAGYPHLHVVFTYGANWPYTSFPVTFKNTIPNERSLQSGVMYPALPK